MGKIVLEGIEFFAFHGNYPEERQIGGRYRVDLTLDCPIEKASKTDILEETIDYSQVYNAIAEEMKIPSKLIEHLAGRILDRIMSDFTDIAKASIKVSKMNPPVKARIEAVSVVLEKQREV
jgi:dihydroneopterin aldolase